MAKGALGRARKVIAAKVAIAKAKLASPKTRADAKATAKKATGKLLRSTRARNTAKGVGWVAKKAYKGVKKFHTVAGEAVQYGIGVHPNYRKAAKRIRKATRNASKW